MKTLKFMLAAATAIGLASASQAVAPLAGSTSFEDGAVPATGGLWTLPAGAEEGDYTIIDSGLAADGKRSNGAKLAWPSTTKALNLEGGVDPLLRAVAAEPVDLTADGVYIDTLVQFTVTPYGDTVTAGDGDKLMIYLAETTNGVGEVTGTNLMVKACKYTPPAGVTPASFVTNDVAVSTSVLPNTWYRLTVKATLVNLVSMFEIFLDGVQLTSTPSLYQSSGMFFPALTGKTDTTLRSVGFAGSGKVDDLLFTTVNPDVTVVDFTIVLAGDMNGFSGDPTWTSTASSGTLNSGNNAAVCYGIQGEQLATVSYTLVDGYSAAWSPSDPADGVEADTTYTLTVTKWAPDFTLADGVTVTTNGNGTYTFNAPAGFVISSLTVNGAPADPSAAGKGSYNWTLVDGATVVVAVAKLAAEHPWYESPAAVVLASDLPHQGPPDWVAAFHGQGEGEYLGLTYATNPTQFDLFQVDGTNALTTVKTIAAADQPNAGLRGVAISKTLGIALLCSYYKYGDTSSTGTAVTTNMLAVALSGNGEPAVVTRSDLIAFDSAAFSPDGQYLFSNALSGESSQQFIVKWSVSNGGATLTKVNSKDAGGRSRALAYARINNRDLVFVMADSGKVVVMDMTGDDATAWTVTDLVTGLPKVSYGTLCVSGVNVYGAPHLTVATSANGKGNNSVDLLNVYELSVPDTGTVTATLTKSFNQDALTDAYFGDISDASRYGNTVYVTDDEKTIYFGRPDCNLYAAEYATYYTNTFISGEGTTTNVTLIAEGRTEPGRGPVTPAEVTGKTFTGWDPAVVPAVADATYTAQYEAEQQGTELEPGQMSAATYNTLADAQAALANVEIVAADDIATNETITAAAKEAYLAKFEAKVIAITSEPVTYAVQVALTAAAEADLQTEANTNVAAVVEAFTDRGVTVGATPGFYYSISRVGSLPGDFDAGEGDRVLAENTTVTIPMPEVPLGATAGFYKVMVNIAPKAPAPQQGGQD